MARSILSIFCGILLLLAGCKKDNYRITDQASLTEDSVIYNELDSNGNSYYELRFSTSDDNIQTLLNPYQHTNSAMLYYTSQAGIHKIEYKEITCASDPEKEATEYLEFKDGHFSDAYVSLYKIGCYGQEGGSYSTQNADYQSDKKLHSLNYRYVYMYGPTIQTESRRDYVFSYDGSVISKIDVNFNKYSNYHRDSASSNLTNIVTYPHQYRNLKEFHGIDLNDLILNLLLQNTKYAIPLILNSKISFNTHSEYLIENIHFPQTPENFVMHPSYERIISFNKIDNDVDLNIQYAFNDDAAKRINNMTILLNNIPIIKYTFKYKD